MTKVTLHYDLIRPLEEADLPQLANLHSVYGMVRVRPAASLKALTVDYDASRLMKSDVEAVLMRYGMPIRSNAQAVA
jgi:hypothetical protein